MLILKHIVFNCIIFLCILLTSVNPIHNQTPTAKTLLKNDNNNEQNVIHQQPELLVQAPQVASMVSKPDKSYPYKTIDKQKPIVVQYQFDDGLDCNGAYLKLMKSNNQFSASPNNPTGEPKRPYSVMFGVDKCGVDAKLHFIMQYLNPKTNQYEEKHWKSAQQVSGLMQLPTELDDYGAALIEQSNPTLSLYESNLITNDKDQKSSAVQNVGSDGFCALMDSQVYDVSGREIPAMRPNKALPNSNYNSRDLSKTDIRSYYQQQFISNAEQDTFPTILNAMRYYWIEVSALCVFTGLLMNYMLALIKKKFSKATNEAQSSIANGLDLQDGYARGNERSKSDSRQDFKKLMVAGPILHEDGVIQIGKITFDPKLHLGYGCRGTCVFKGTFESKQVCAVKRLLSQYVTLAGREIEFLRSLQHPNLVRYLATEEDAQFIYIALELAELTLADLVESDKKCNIDDVGLTRQELCRQSALGLNHLHNLNIVHRDIKPQNILISFPLRPNNERKVMISDFGVSKQLANIDINYTSSVSRCLDGTQGWIAPEIINAKLDDGINLRPSKSADIFALGCVFYYIYSEGRHPFGNLLDRQVNISKGNFELNLNSYPNQNAPSGTPLEKDYEVLATHLIESMISSIVSERPPIEAVLCYPLFWAKSRQLQFLLDVSDRIEKEKDNSDIVSNIEFARSDIVDHDWKSRLSKDLEDDLRKFRAYRETRISHLLRAIRNKKNHYYELPEDLKRSLGDIPDQYTDYFTRRFPKLLPHVYIAIQGKVSRESIFKPYYVTEPRFSSTNGDGNRSNSMNQSQEFKDGDSNFGNYFKWPDLKRSWRRAGQLSPRKNPEKVSK